MYGTQALSIFSSCTSSFENDVKMYGTQAILPFVTTSGKFENDVKMYGTQAGYAHHLTYHRLRMM